MTEQWSALVASVRARLHADLDARLNLLAAGRDGGAAAGTLVGGNREIDAAQSASGVLTGRPARSSSPGAGWGACGGS